MAKSQIFLLLGPEIGEKDNFIKELKSKIEKQTKEKPEYFKFYPFDTQLLDIITVLQNGSLFSAHKMVVLANVEALKKEELKILSQYCKQPNEESTLILTSDSIQISETIKKSIPKENTKIFWEMFENQKQNWIINYLKKVGLSIEKDALELLLDLIENNTQDMKIICDRISLFYPKGTTLETDQIEEFVFHSKEENVFTLFEKISQKDLKSSLEIIMKIKNSGETSYVQLLGGILWQFRRLLNFSALISENYSQTEAFKKLNIRGKKNQSTYYNGSKNYKLEDLQRIIVLISKYDGYLRNVKQDLQNNLILLFLYFCINNNGKEPEVYSPSGALSKIIQH